MALFNVNFEIEGAALYSRSFDAYAREVDDLREPFDQIADVVVDSVGEQFTTEGRHGQPEGWHPLEPGYRLWKEQHYPGRPILVRTGAMRRAATSKSEAVVITPQRMLYEVHSDYAAYHQRGAGNLPERRIVNLTLGERRQFDRILSSWLNSLRRGPIGVRP